MILLADEGITQWLEKKGRGDHHKAPLERYVREIAGLGQVDRKCEDVQKKKKKISNTRMVMELVKFRYLPIRTRRKMYSSMVQKEIPSFLLNFNLNSVYLKATTQN